MEKDTPQTLAVQGVSNIQPVQEVNLTAKDGLLIATECHLALLPDEDGDTALHLAVVQGNFEACKKLVELFRIAGKSIDVHNNLLQTPLHVAVITNHTDIVKLLICHGSDPSNPDRYGSTAFHLCAKYGRPQCLLEILQNLGDRKPNLSVRDYEGLTALHVAVTNRSVSTFKLLVANGADIDAKDNKGGRTPLIYAIELNERSMVELLLECDASVSQQTYSGDTALHIASGRGLQEIVRLLLRRGADATMKNTHSETPMSLATSPSVSDILNTQYNPKASPEMKAINVAHSQLGYAGRGIAIPVARNFVKFSGSPDSKGSPPILSREQALAQKIPRKFKIEYGGDEATPPKRVAVFGPQGLPLTLADSAIAIARSAVKVGEPVILPRNIPIKHEYTEFKAGVDEEENSAGSSSRGSDNRDEDTSKQAPDFSDEHVEIAMEEVEVSAEEEVHKSDDESSPESHSSSFQDSPKKVILFSGASDQPYKHKLMQYSTNTLSKGFKDASSLDSKDDILNKDSDGNKPVIVQRQPQIDLASVLSRDYRSSIETEPSYKSFTPSVSPRSSGHSSHVLMKSKSVPNSPQPAEANLYQLAREGLAVAAMANSNPSQSSGKEFGLSNYLKARPSRQAKIKSGTEELQNLALQGLAVAAMNAQSELFQKSNGKKKQKSAEEEDASSTVTSVPNHLSQVLKPLKEGQPPTLHRSNSMPPKQYFEHDATSPDTYSVNLFSSNQALLALAHANAMKEHVGQAVSAKSMARSANPSLPKFLPITTSVPSTGNEISENTKHSLRQAIMVKNPTTVPNVNQKPQPLEVYNPKRKQYQFIDTNTPGVRIYEPKLGGTQSTISIKILPTNAVRNVTPTSKLSKSEEPLPGQLPGVTVAHSTFTMPVAVSVTKTEATRPAIKVSTPMSTSVSTSSEMSCAPVLAEQTLAQSSHPTTSVAQAKTTILSQNVKSTKDSAPTHTVAPLQMPPSKGTAKKTDSNGQPKLVSVAMAPVVTSRVASPAVQLPPAGPSSETDPGSTSSSSLQQLSPLTSVLPSATFSSVANGVPTLPHVALGGIQPQVLNPLTNLSLVRPHTAASYLQHHIAYVPHGKDLIPVIVPQVQLPPYAAATALQVQSNQGDVAKSSTSAVATNGADSAQQYLGGVSKLPAIDPKVLYQMPLPIQDAQLRGVYPLYGAQLSQTMDPLQHQHVLKNTLLYGQSLLPQHKPVGPQLLTAVTGLPSKPVAAVSAVPVHKAASPKASSSGVKVTSQSSDEQPLNLSKKPTLDDQPLNLMKTHPVTKILSQNEGSFRSSVIKAVSSVQSEASKGTRVDALNTTTAASDLSVLTQTHAGVYLPPPVILNPAVQHASPSSALSALSLPPIHYVNGMPFIFSVPPQI